MNMQMMQLNQQVNDARCHGNSWNFQIRNSFHACRRLNIWIQSRHHGNEINLKKIRRLPSSPAVILAWQRPYMQCRPLAHMRSRRQANPGLFSARHTP